MRRDCTQFISHLLYLRSTSVASIANARGEYDAFPIHHICRVHAAGGTQAGSKPSEVSSRPGSGTGARIASKSSQPSKLPPFSDPAYAHATGMASHVVSLSVPLNPHPTPIFPCYAIMHSVLVFVCDPLTCCSSPPLTYSFWPI